MSGITTSVGLISGINTADLIDQLMAIEGRPKTLIDVRNKTLKVQQDALKDINKSLLALKLEAAKFTLPTAFRQTKGTSSNEGVLTVKSGAAATQGNYSFLVSRLVSSQQTITRGFADKDATPVAPAGGTLTFERGEARLDSTKLLTDLNGGEGIQRGLIRVTDRSGATATIDLRSVATVDDALNKINSATGVSIFAEVDGDALKITDLSGGSASNLIIADVGASTTATSLGIVGNSATGTIDGTQINTVGEGTLLSSLNDGNGVRNKAGVADLRISAGGTDYDIDLDGVRTVGDLLESINSATGGAVTGAITADGVGIELNGPGGFTVASLNASGAAEDLRLAGAADGAGLLEGGRVMAAMGSKLLSGLKGGTGIGLGTISITNRAGAATSVDLSGAESVSDVINAINDAGAGVTASLNNAGNGLQLRDTSGGTGDITVAEGSGTAAADLGLLGTHAGDTVDGGNLQFKYITEATRLEALGITRGRFALTDSDGKSTTIDLTDTAIQTIGDVVDKINSRGLSVTARINDNGDGILLEDGGSGAVAIRTEELGSTTAKELNLLGEAAAPGEDINGSFEKTVTLDSDDTLQDVATKIQEASLGISASIISDGSAANPYRLSLGAKTPGTNGAFVFDDGGLGLGASTLSKAQDAVVFYGSSDPAAALVITSKTNSLAGIIPGATIDLQATSDQPVQVTIDADEEAMVAQVQAFVDAFNAVTAKIEEADSYDAETQTRGILLGDSGLAIVRQQLFGVVISRNTDLTSQYNSLAQIGITVGSESQLKFNSEKFLEALETDPEAVDQLFKFKETEEDAEGNTVISAKGVGVAIDEMLKRLTDPEFGALESRIDIIEGQIGVNTRRMEDLDKILAQKRTRLERQFAAMESALAQMQQQSGALANLSALAAQAKSG